MFDSSKLPAVNKTAAITLVPKKGDPADLDEQRPISLLPVGLKVLTRMVTCRLAAALEKQKRIIPEQAGFRNFKEPSKSSRLWRSFLERKAASGVPRNEAIGPAKKQRLAAIAATGQYEQFLQERATDEVQLGSGRSGSAPKMAHSLGPIQLFTLLAANPCLYRMVATAQSCWEYHERFGCFNHPSESSWHLASRHMASCGPLKLCDQIFAVGHKRVSRQLARADCG